MEMSPLRMVNWLWRKVISKPTSYVKPKMPEKPVQQDFVADYFNKRGISNMLINLKSIMKIVG